MRVVPGAWPFALGVAAVTIGAVVWLARSMNATSYTPLFLPLGVAVFVLVFVPPYVLLRRVKITIEKGGLRVREGLGAPFFVGFDAIAKVTVDGRDVVIERASEPTLRYAVGPVMRTRTEDVGLVEQALEATAVANAIERARDGKGTS